MQTEPVLMDEPGSRDEAGLPDEPGSRDEAGGPSEPLGAVRELFARGAASAVHAYAIVGPSGAPVRAAATRAAQTLVCAWADQRRGDLRPGCGQCPACIRVERGVHPDVVVFERVGPYLTVEQINEAIRVAQRSAVELDRKVVVLIDVHLLPATTAPMLLKTLEEPPPSTVFVLSAQQLDGPLATLASRCVVVPIPALPFADLVREAVANGRDANDAELLAIVAGGDQTRLRALLADPGAVGRARFWHGLADRVDGTAAQAMALTREALALCDTAPAAGDADVTAVDGDDVAAEETSGKGRGSAAVAARRREARRARTDELRAGLALLAHRVRERLADPDRRVSDAAVEALSRMERFHRELVRNPNESAQLLGIIVSLPDVRGKGSVLN